MKTTFLLSLIPAALLSLASCNTASEVSGPLAVRSTRFLFKPLGVKLHNRLETTSTALGDPHGTKKGQRFQNEPTLLHLAANEFYFEQSTNQPFAFTSHLVTRNHKPWTIKPMSMLTTGATVPRMFWSVKGFGAMDFAKSAVIHDWLFEAHHRWCIAYYTADSSEASSRRLSHQTLRELKDYADPALQKNLLDALAKGTLKNVSASEQKRLHTDIESGLTLSIVEAADIMMECIDWEMCQCEAFVKRLEELVKSKKTEAGRNLSDGEIYGIQAIIKDLKHVTHSSITLAQWHWSIRSFVAKKYWNSERGGAKAGHASSDLTISALKESGLFKRAQESGYLSANAISRLSSPSSTYETIAAPTRVRAYEALSREAEAVKSNAESVSVLVPTGDERTMRVQAKTIY